MDVAGELAAVGTLHDEGYGHVAERVGGIVAHERHELHRLARAVDAAFGVEECIDRARLRPTVDAAVGQVESGLGEFEAGELLAVAGHRHDGDRLGRTLALQQARSEGSAPVGGRDNLADRFVAARQQDDLDARQRLGGLQRPREDVQPVLASEAREADVGVDHPHAGGASRIVLVVVVARGWLGGVPDYDEIGTGLPVLDGLADREGRDDGLVGDAAHVHRACPLLGAVAAVQPVPERPRLGDRLGAREGLVVVVGAVGGEALDAALVHAIDRDADLRDVDGGDGQAGGAAARQDEAFARQVHDGWTGAQRDSHFLVGGELLAAAARQALAQRDLVVLPVGEARDAQPVVVGA